MEGAMTTGIRNSFTGVLICAGIAIAVAGAARLVDFSPAFPQQNGRATKKAVRGLPGAVKRLAGVAATPAHQLAANYGKVPLGFEANEGQTDPRVKFLSRGRGYSLFLTGDGPVLALREKVAQHLPSGAAALANPLSLSMPKEKSENEVERLRGRRAGPTLPSSSRFGDSGERSTVLRMRLVGANASAVVTGAEEMPGKSNYFIGNDPKKWRTNVPNYAKVKYAGVYPGVDLVYYGNQGGQLEYDFVVAPGANPNVIVLDVAAGLSRHPSSKKGGVKPPLQIAADGDLVVQTDGGEVRFHKPLVYQSKSSANRQSAIGNRQVLEGHYVLTASNQVHFSLGPYDHTKPLVVDPVLSYSTYLGGTGEEVGVGIAVDSSGSAYAFGYTGSADFPVTPGAYQASCKDIPHTSECSGDAFITKFSPDGKSLEYSTFLGGSGGDVGNTYGGIAVDSSDEAYVTALTFSTDFPTTAGAFQPSCTLLPGDNGAACVATAFVSKLSSDGSQLLYSTYLGGSIGTESTGIAVDSSGNAFVTGFTSDQNFPVTSNAYQTVCASPGPNPQDGCASSGFLAELNPAASGSASLVYSTYFGTSQSFGIAVDTTGRPFITGSGSVPTTPGAFESRVANCGTGNNPPCPQAFVGKFDTTQTGSASLLYSTGLCSTYPLGIAIDSSGNAYITGSTQGFNGYANGCLTANGFQTAPAGWGDAFLIELDHTGSSIPYSTHPGGSYSDVGNSVAADSTGKTFVTGQTASIDFPLMNPIDLFFGGSGHDNTQEAFVTEIDTTQSGTASLIYSTYLGNSPDLYDIIGQHIAADSSGNAYVIGYTNSPNLLIANPFEPTLQSLEMAFVSKIGAANAPGVAFVPGAQTFGNQKVGTPDTPRSITLTAAGSQPLIISGVSFSKPDPGDFAQTNTCGTLPATLAAGSNCTLSITFTPTAVGTRTAAVSITDNASDSPQTASLTGAGEPNPGASLSATSVSFGNQVINTLSATKDVALTSTVTTSLIISTIAITGANASDFAVNNCPASLAP